MRNMARTILCIGMIVAWLAVAAYATSEETARDAQEAAEYAQEAYDYAKKASMSDQSRAKFLARKAMAAALNAKKAAEAIQSELDKETNE